MIGLTRPASTAALSQWDADGSGGILSDRIVRWDTFCTWMQLTEFKSMYLNSARELGPGFCKKWPKMHCCKLSIMVPHGIYLHTFLNFHNKTDDFSWGHKEEEKHLVFMFTFIYGSKNRRTSTWTPGPRVPHENIILQPWSASPTSPVSGCNVLSDQHIPSHNISTHASFSPYLLCQQEEILWVFIYLILYHFRGQASFNLWTQLQPAALFYRHSFPLIQ